MNFVQEQLIIVFFLLGFWTKLHFELFIDSEQHALQIDSSLFSKSFYEIFLVLRLYPTLNNFVDAKKLFRI